MAGTVLKVKPATAAKRVTKAKPVTVAIHPVQRRDFLVSGAGEARLNCRTALLFPDSAPMADQAVAGPDRRAKATAVRKADKTESSTLDLQAVWAHVAKPPVRNESSVLVFLHGHYTHVTINHDGTCARPSWADTDYTPKTDAAGAGPGCAANGYKIVDALWWHDGPLIALAPENARPYISSKRDPGKPRQFFGTIPGKHIFNQPGSLSQPGSLGTLVDECLQRLVLVKTVPGRPPCPQPPLTSVPSVKRLFLAGHSGAHTGIFASAKSSIIETTPTDLILLDCFYVDGRDALRHFAARAKGGLGNGPNQSRILLAHDPGSYGPGEDNFPTLKNMLLTEFKGQATEVKYPRGRNDAQSALQPTREALRKFPIVIVSGSLGHFSIPPDYIPRVLETAAK